MERSTSVKNLYPFGGIEGCVRFIMLMLLMSGDRLITATMEFPTQVEIEELSKQNNTAIKTIQSANGEIIDCVDIYKQPAFDHPLLKNHSIEMRPSFIPDLKRGNSSSYAIAEQSWLKSGSCPKGTIPILRVTKDDLLGANSSESYSIHDVEPTNCRIEVAGALVRAEAPYYGVTGIINVWSLLVMTKEWSLNSIAAVNEHSLVESGWGASPILFGDSKTRFIANWRDGNKGCFNLRCPGFVQVSSTVALGAFLYPTSEYNGKQYVIHPTIYKDDVQKKWWLMLEDEVVGYWPMVLFSNLESASIVEWLGRVCDTQERAYHTATQMGSGRWPSEGFGLSSYIQDPLVMFKSSSDFIVAKWLEFPATYSNCYNVNLYSKGNSIGVFYGGPGGYCCDGRC